MLFTCYVAAELLSISHSCCRLSTASLPFHQLTTKAVLLLPQLPQCVCALVLAMVGSTIHAMHIQLLLRIASIPTGASIKLHCTSLPCHCRAQ
jgi:hypothetical protein